MFACARRCPRINLYNVNMLERDARLVRDRGATIYYEDAANERPAQSVQCTGAGLAGPWRCVTHCPRPPSLLRSDSSHRWWAYVRRVRGYFRAHIVNHALCAGCACCARTQTHARTNIGPNARACIANSLECQPVASKHKRDATDNRRVCSVRFNPAAHVTPVFESDIVGKTQAFNVPFCRAHSTFPISQHVHLKRKINYNIKPLTCEGRGGLWLTLSLSPDNTNNLN